MALPIGATPILKGEDAKQFFETIAKDLKTPATLTATPKLDQALKKIRENARYIDEEK